MLWALRNAIEPSAISVVEPISTKYGLVRSLSRENTMPDTAAMPAAVPRAPEDVSEPTPIVFR